MSLSISRELMHQMWPNGNSKVAGLLEGIADSSESVLAKYNITSSLVVAQAMAQFSVECGAGEEMIENINYSAQRACQVWPTHFKNAADCYAKCDSYSGDPDFHVKLIDHVYGGRMGNKPYPSHDGSTHIGMGLPQCTGAEEYAKLGEKVGLDLINHPELINSPEHAFECGIADFILDGCLPDAEADNVEGVTHHLNGGYIGLEDRKKWLVKWKAVMAKISPLPEPIPNSNPTPRPPVPLISPNSSPVVKGSATALGFMNLGVFFQHHILYIAIAGIITVGLVVAYEMSKK